MNIVVRDLISIRLRRFASLVRPPFPMLEVRTAIIFLSCSSYPVHFHVCTHSYDVRHEPLRLWQGKASCYSRVYLKKPPIWPPCILLMVNFWSHVWIFPYPRPTGTHLGCTSRSLFDSLLEDFVFHSLFSCCRYQFPSLGINFRESSCV